MKYVVNDGCIGCGLCEGTCPEVFSMSDAGVAVAIDTDVPDAALSRDDALGRLVNAAFSLPPPPMRKTRRKRYWQAR